MFLTLLFSELQKIVNINIDHANHNVLPITVLNTIAINRVNVTIHRDCIGIRKYRFRSGCPCLPSFLRVYPAAAILPGSMSHQALTAYRRGTRDRVRLQVVIGDCSIVDVDFDARIGSGVGSWEENCITAIVGS